MIRSFLVSMAVALSLLIPSIGGAAYNSLGIIPADYEVVVTLDTRQIADSSLFQKVWAEIENPQTKARLTLLKTLSGVDLLKDVDRVTFFSRVNDDESACALFEGRFEEAKLLLLVQANGSYKTSQVGSFTVHEWLDDKEQAMRYAIFPVPGVVGIWNSRAAIESSINTLANPASSLGGGEDAAKIPAGADKMAGWGILITRQTTCPGAKLRVANAAMTMQIQNDSLALNSIVTPDSIDIVPQWIDLAKGAKALGQIQRDNPKAAELAEQMFVSPSSDGRSVVISGSLDSATLLDIAKKNQ